MKFLSGHEMHFPPTFTSNLQFIFLNPTQLTHCIQFNGFLEPQPTITSHHHMGRQKKPGTATRDDLLRDRLRGKDAIKAQLIKSKFPVCIQKLAK